MYRAAMLHFCFAVQSSAGLVVTPRLPQPVAHTHALLRASPASMNFFAKFLQEIDNFADDAVGRRMGNGAKFYGKRKSSFYGEDDAMKKTDSQLADAEEDYSGPAGGSYFVLSEERDEQGRPMEFLTRQEARRRAKEKEEAQYRSMGEEQEMTESFLAALRAESE